MKITTLKRFEFSAARQLADQRWRGDNFILWAGVSGPLDAATGMVINVSDLKATVNHVLDCYDHRYLNHQLSAEPTTLDLARALWSDLAPLFPAPRALASVELQEEDGPAARLAPTPTQIVYGGFSAAHRTHAPRLSDDENRALYGICNNPAGHGHNYRVALFLPVGASVDPALWAEFDHRNLSTDLPALRGRNVVTETIAELIARRAPPAERVRVWETPTFFAEHRRADGAYALGRRYRFNAAHRLHSRALSDEANERIYGKCNRPDPHGHSYFVEVTLRAEALEPRTETAYDLGQLDKVACGVLRSMDHTYLDMDVPFFRERPSTGENIAWYVWGQFASALGPALESARVWETPNNQFVIEQG